MRNIIHIHTSIRCVKLVKTANQNVRCTPRAMFSSRSQRSEKSNDSDAALSTATVSCPATDREGPWPNRYGSCTPPTATLKRSLIWCFEHQWDGNHGMLLMTSENTCERKLKDEPECGKFTLPKILTFSNFWIFGASGRFTEPFQAGSEV